MNSCVATVYARVQIAVLSMAVMIPVFSGCSNAGFVAVPVSGVVTLNGDPVEDALVVFVPVNKKNPGPPSSARTDEDGTFTLTFGDGKKGAVVGTHNVSVSTLQRQRRDDNSGNFDEIVPEKIPLSYSTSPFIFEVPEGGTSEAEIALTGESPRKKSRELLMKRPGK